MCRRIERMECELSCTTDSPTKTLIAFIQLHSMLAAFVRLTKQLHIFTSGVHESVVSLKTFLE